MVSSSTTTFVWAATTDDFGDIDDLMPIFFERSTMPISITVLYLKICVMLVLHSPLSCLELDQLRRT